MYKIYAFRTRFRLDWFAHVTYNSCCIVLVGEISLICYSLEGNLIWKNSYRNTIFDWFVTDKGLSVVFENDEKWLITLKDGNGIRVE